MGEDGAFQCQMNRSCMNNILQRRGEVSNRNRKALTVGRNVI